MKSEELTTVYSPATIPKRSRTTALVRLLSLIILTDLATQVSLGFWLEHFVTLPHSSYSVPISDVTSSSSSLSLVSAILSVASSKNPLLIAHMMNGFLVFFLSIIAFLVSLDSDSRELKGLGFLGSCSILMAGLSGLSYVLSNYQSDAYSVMMGAGFTLATLSYVLLFYSSGTSPRRRTTSMMLLLCVEGFSSFSGLYGGIALIADPSGALLGLHPSILSSLPFSIHNFFLPGLWIFFVYGIGFALVTYLLWSGGKPYVWSLSLVLCFVWLGWLTFEVIFLGPDPLSEAYYVLQIAALFLLLTGRREVAQL